ncbi:hypothetical protein BH11MYX4_BH11MYX4_65840 [soil metagenome]
MVKKLFALASVTALTGLMAAVAASGCSSSTVVDTTPTIEAGPDVKVTPKDAAPIDEPDTGPATCPTTTPVTSADIGLTWVAPGAPQSVCNQGDLDALKKVFADGKGSAKYTDIEKSLGATCGPCVFTAVKGARWGMIIKDGANVVADNSLGACFGALSTAECGKARFEIDSCLDIACPQQDCGTDTQACNTKALKGACKSFVAPYTTACTDENALIASCTNFVRIIEVTCGGGPDAGLDSGI